MQTHNPALQHQAPAAPADATPDERLLLETYHAALSNYIYEGQVFWNRISAFVLLNSALLVARNALPAGPADNWTRTGIGLLGIAAVVLLAHTAVRAHYINAFWLATLRDVEEQLGMHWMGPFGYRERYLAGLPLRLPSGLEMRMPWYARINVNDSSSAVLTIVFGAIWIVSIARLIT